MAHDHKYIIVNVSDISDDMMNNSQQTYISELKTSVNGTKAILKYEADIGKPVSYSGYTVYTHDEILVIIATGEWDPNYVYTNDYYISLGGTNEDLTLTDDGTLHFESGGNDQAFSISFWFKSGTAAAHNIICHGTNDFNTEYRINFSGTSGWLFFGLYDSAANAIRVDVYQGSLSDIYDDVWHHIVCTYDGSAAQTGMEIYVDGAIETDTRYSSSYTYMNTNSGTFKIGSNGSSYGTFDIDEIAIWDKELTSDEVSELYDSGNLDFQLSTHSAYANIISYWNAEDDNDDTSSTIYDQVGGNDLDCNNMEVGDKTAHA